MGRSVNYLNNSETVIYFTADWINEDEDFYTENFNDFRSNLEEVIMSKLKSYTREDKFEGNEVAIILDNELCNIGLSEYCGLYSLSVAPKDTDYPENNFAERHAEVIETTLRKCLHGLGAKLLQRLGTFSTGCGVFQEAKGDILENGEVVLPKACQIEKICYT